MVDRFETVSWRCANVQIARARQAGAFLFFVTFIMMRRQVMAIVGPGINLAEDA